MPSLLIVDDNRELGRLLAVVAEAYGFVPKLASTGQEARAALAAQPEAALVDLLLPDIKGTELIAEFTSAGVRCAAMSGVFKGSAFSSEATAAGARAFFEKPFVARDVMEQLSTLLAAAVPSSEEVPELDAESLTPLEDAEAEILTGAAPPAIEELGPETLDPLGELGPEALELLGELGPEALEPLSEPAPEAAGEELAPEAIDPIEELEQLVGSSAGVFTRAAAPPPLPARAAPAGEEPTRVYPAPATLGEALSFVPEVEAQEEPTVVYPPPAPPARELPEARPEPRPAVRKPAPSKSPAKASPSPSVPLPFSDRKVWHPSAEKAPSAGRDERGPRAGSLAETSLPRLLTALHQARQTGELRLRRRNVVKVIALRNGRVAFAISNLGADRFGPAAVRAGALGADALKELQSEAARSGMKTAEAALALGLMSEAARGAVVEKQVKEIVWSVLDWTDGEYQFALRSPRADLVPLSLAVGPLVLEGMGRAHSLVKLRELVAADAHLFPTADPPFELHELELRDHDAMLLAHADGSKTVEDLVLLGELEERATLALLRGLEQLGILEARAPRASRRVVLV